jgi:hypothetical protein
MFLIKGREESHSSIPLFPDLRFIKILIYFFFSCNQKCRLKEEPLTFGALSVLKHLLPRFLLFLLFVIMIYPLTGTYQKKKKIYSLTGAAFLITSIAGCLKHGTVKGLYLLKL